MAVATRIDTYAERSERSQEETGAECDQRIE